MSSVRVSCHFCKDSLQGKKYILKEDTQYCAQCYENLFSNCCEECTLPIGCNNKVKASGGRIYQNINSIDTGVGMGSILM